MEDEKRGSRLAWIAITAVAPIAWGSNYYVIREFLPAEYPLWGAALRALPAGTLLILLVRSLPIGVSLWRMLLLSVLNFGGFLVLVYLAAQLLPSSVAASVMALAPFAYGLLGALLLRKPLTAWTLAGATSGLVGVLLIVGLAAERVDGWGVAASVAALACNALGAILTERWRGGMPIMTLTAWQLLAGGAMLAAAALAVEGAPPRLDASGIAAILYISIVSTALAYVCWFSALARLSPGVVGTIGLLNPVTGVLLGVLLAGELLTLAQALGIALVLAGIFIGQGRTKTASSDAGLPRGSSMS